MTFGGALRLAGIDEISQQRLQSREIFGQVSNPVAGYFFTLTLFAVNPLLIAYGIWTKRRRIVIAGIAGQLLIYSVAASRQSLLGIGLIILAYACLRTTRALSAVVVRAMIGVIAALMLLSVFFPSQRYHLEWMFYRTWVTPVVNGAIFFEYFSENEKTYFSHVKGLSWLSHNPYERAHLGLVIGAAQGDPSHQMNSHFWADGYAGAGIAGMVFVTVITGIALLLLDSVAHRLDQGCATLAVVIHGVNLVHLPIFTAILGSGLGLSIMLLWLLPIHGRRNPSPPVEEGIKS